MTEDHKAESDRVVKVLTRHRFVAVPGSDEHGFCAGPYCAGGIVTPAEHAEHVAALLPINPPGSEGER